jgi:hypothetical protein
METLKHGRDVFGDPLQGCSKTARQRAREESARTVALVAGAEKALKRKPELGVPFCGLKDPLERMDFGRNLKSAAGMKEGPQGFGRSKPSKG